MADCEASIEAACYADIGGRTHQQDRVAVLGKGDSKLLVLADGLGGHSDGGLAAEAVVEAAEERLGEWAGGDAEELLASIVKAAHQRIRKVGAERRGSPHSTCVLLHISQTVAVWAHVGDSRMYHFESGKLVGRTLDHSIVELMRLQGRLSEEEMKAHPDQNRLYASLGGSRPPEPETGGAAVFEFSGFLLVSDGVWENATNADMRDVFRGVELAAGVRRLVERAKANGGSSCDNLAAAGARPSRRSPGSERGH
ncbi:MAG: serine/threonine-protein phosphatase [Acidobacteriota bacterium]|nr:serine/threonine-protein phosphatase [Acidobacteriota bacterium]